MKIASIDHIVLTVASIEATCEVYTRALGMRVETFDDGKTALRFGDQKINLHRAGREFEPKAAHPTRGSGDVCFLTTTPITDVVEHLASEAVPLVEGPVARTGATGALISVYIRDPDGNLVEIANREEMP